MTESFPENGLRSALALLAEAAPEPVTTDLEAARRAWADGRRPGWQVRAVALLRERPALAWPVVAAVAAAAVVVVLLLTSAVAALTLPQPVPAVPVRGPGALPEKVFVAPPWTPSATQAPIARAAYLVKVQSRSGLGIRAMVVSADDGSYRQVPGSAAENGVLSRDGRRLAWAEERGGSPTQAPRTDLFVLDLPTGRVRRMRVMIGSDIGSTVSGLALDRRGVRLALWGSALRDASSGIGMDAVIDLGPVGSTSPLRVVASCTTCGGEVVWLDDGRLGHEAGFTQLDGVGGLAGAVVPSDPRTGGFRTRASGFGAHFSAGPALAVDGTGSTRYVVVGTAEGDTWSGQRYRLVAVGAPGATTSTELGTPMDAAVLAVVPDAVLVVLAGPTPPGRFGDARVTVERVTPAGRAVVSTVERRALVTQVAGEIAAGGATAVGRAPGYGPLTWRWWAWHVRDPYVVLGLVAGVALATGLLVRFVPGPWRRSRRRSPSAATTVPEDGSREVPPDEGPGDV